MTTFGFIMMVVGVAFFSGSAIHVIDRLDRPQQRRRTGEAVRRSCHDTRGGEPQAPEGHEAQADDEVEDRVQRGEDPPRTLPGRFLLK